MAAKLCRECRKKAYTEHNALKAAIYSSRSFGKGMRIYPCPYHPKQFHLTSQAKRHDATDA